MSVELIVEGAVAKVVLNRPERMNALTWEMREQLTAHFHRVRFDDAIRAVIVTGAGNNFCAGADVTKMAKGDLREGRERLQRGSQSYIRQLHAIEKPVIAAVQGVAVGVGWSIALACDMVVCGAGSRFGAVFRRLGLAPDGGNAWFLTRRVGMARAKELVFSARMVGGAEAASLGLVEHVVADDGVMAKAEELAADFAEGPTFAMGLAKKLIHYAMGPSLEDYLEMESLVQPALHATADNPEGVAAFKEKRKPRFVGR